MEYDQNPYEDVQVFVDGQTIISGEFRLNDEDFTIGNNFRVSYVEGSGYYGNEEYIVESGVKLISGRNITEYDDFKIIFSGPKFCDFERGGRKYQRNFRTVNIMGNRNQIELEIYEILDEDVRNGFSNPEDYGYVKIDYGDKIFSRDLNTFVFGQEVEGCEYGHSYSA